MIGVNDRRVERAWLGGKPVAMLLTATRKIWEAVRSCFGSGFWREQKMWSDTEKWKD